MQKGTKVKIITDPIIDKDVLTISASQLLPVKDVDGAIEVDGSLTMIQVRNSGNFEGKAIYLDRFFNWVITTDEEGALVLLPYANDLHLPKPATYYSYKNGTIYQRR